MWVSCESVCFVHTHGKRTYFLNFWLTRGGALIIPLGGLRKQRQYCRQDEEHGMHACTHSIAAVCARERRRACVSWRRWTGIHVVFPCQLQTRFSVTNNATTGTPDIRAERYVATLSEILHRKEQTVSQRAEMTKKCQN
jgi:hypothetical protein